MAEAFLERKIKTLFSRFDADGSGSIEEADFNKWADRLIAFGEVIFLFSCL
jgi:Ca2+-binding EF-hand superfamily protein